MTARDEYAEIADLYDHVTIYRERPDIGFFVEAAREAGSPVLELGSGTGRVLLPTARAGITITGLDASPGMLTICRRFLDREPEAVRARVRLVEGDMRSFDFGQRFTLVTLPFRPFQHLTTVEEQLACLARIRQHLLPEGRLILDLFNPSLESLIQPTGVETPESEFTTPDGRKVVRSFKALSRDRATQVIQLELIYDVTHADGRIQRLVQSAALRYFFRFEAEHLLARAGFAVEHLYAGYDKRPFGSVYPGDLIFVARRAD